MFYFNPRSHERSDRNPQAVANNSNISIHAPTRGATIFVSISAAIWSFQSTLPREERRPNFRVALFIMRFQSTLPREERQYDRVEGSRQSISIHAPTRGATQSGNSLRSRKAISIHAPTRGATWTVHRLSTRPTFQSTLPREERLSSPCSQLSA